MENPVDRFISAQPAPAVPWLSFATTHLRTHHQGLTESLYYSMPAWRYGKYEFICFSCHARHFTLHTHDFAFIETLKQRFPNAHFGKGSMQFPYDDESQRAPLLGIIDELARRMTSPEQGA